MKFLKTSIFLFAVVAMAVGTGVVIAQDGSEPVSEPTPSPAIPAQPVKTTVTVTPPSASVATTVSSSLATASSPPAGSFYNPPSPASFVPGNYNAGSSSASASVSSANTPASPAAAYANMPEPAKYNYANAPDARPGSGTAGLTQAAPRSSTNTSVPTTVQVASAPSQPTSANSAPTSTNKVTKIIPTNGSASETISLTSPSGNAYAYASASQSGETGSMELSVEVTE